MTIRRTDSADHYVVEGQKWNRLIQGGSGFGPPVITNGGRFNTNGFSPRPDAGVGHNFGEGNGATTVIVGFAYLDPGGFANDNDGSARLLRLRSISGGNEQQAGLEVRARPNGDVFVFNANGDVTINGPLSAPLVPFDGLHHYLELKVTLGASGTLVWRADQGSTTTLTGNFDIAGPDRADIVDIMIEALTVDDIVIADTLGTVNNDLLGDVAIQARMPTGAGASTQWTPNSIPAQQNWQCVDEAGQPNDETDFISAASAGLLDLYAMADVTATTGTVIALVGWPRARRDAVATSQIRFATRSGGTTGFGSTVTLGDTYAYIPSVVEVDPATAAQFTLAAANAAECGVESVAV